MSQLAGRIFTHLGGRAVIAGAAAVASVAAVGGSAWALTSSSSSTPPAVQTPAPSSGSLKSPAASRAHGRRHHAKAPAVEARLKALVRRAVHVDAVVRMKTGFVTVSIDRGKVTSVSPTSITLQEADGQSVTDSVTSTTRVVPKSVGGIGGVHVGSLAVVGAENSTAKVIWLARGR